MDADLYFPGALNAVGSLDWVQRACSVSLMMSPNVDTAAGEAFRVLVQPSI